MVHTRFTFCLLALVIALTGCGGGNKSQNSSTTTSGANAGASPAASPAAGGANAGYASGVAAPVPANLHCGAVSPVWANPKRKTYHLASDPLYGRTKHGEYMCPQTAASEGYHQAKGQGGYGKGKGHHHRGGGTMQAQPSPSPGM